MGRPLALYPGANQYTGPACGAKKCFIVAAAAGDITTTINKGRRAGPMSSLLLLDVYCSAYYYRQLVVSIPRISAPSCHLMGKINAMGTFFSTRHLWFPSWSAIGIERTSCLCYYLDSEESKLANYENVCKKWQVWFYVFLLRYYIHHMFSFKTICAPTYTPFKIARWIPHPIYLFTLKL